MFIVGPRTMCAPFARASSPSRWPISTTRSESNVAPMAVPHGRHAEGTLPKNLVPRIPLGPSDSRMEGIDSLGMSRVCQKSLPVVMSDALEVSQTTYLREATPFRQSSAAGALLRRQTARTKPHALDLCSRHWKASWRWRCDSWKGWTG